MTSLLGEIHPWRDGAGANEPFGPRFYALLNHPRNAKYQAQSGEYGYRKRLAFGQFESHLRGRDTIAISCVDGERANFLAIDIDQDFERRLPIARDILTRRGLDRATFATSGSGAGRGKLVVTLRERLPQRQAIRLVQKLLVELTSDLRFGKYKASDITKFPQAGDGGHVRLLGYNLKRSRVAGTIVLAEAPLDLDGNLSDLYYVEPAAIPVERRSRRPSSSLSDWAECFISSPYYGNTTALFKEQTRLAFEATRLYGRAKAVDFLSQAFRDIESLSEALTPSTRRNLLRTDVPEKLVGYALSSPNGNHISSDLLWLPRNVKGESRPVVRIYEGLSEYVLLHGLNPNCFGMNYDRIADIVGYAGKPKAWEAVLKTEERGLLVRLDPGVPKQDGKPGLCALFALVGNHNNPTLAQVAGQDTVMYQDRMKERLRRCIPPTALVGRMSAA